MFMHVELRDMASMHAICQARRAWLRLCMESLCPGVENRDAIGTYREQTQLMRKPR